MLVSSNDKCKLFEMNKHLKSDSIHITWFKSLTVSYGSLLLIVCDELTDVSINLKCQLLDPLPCLSLYATHA